MRWFRPSRPVVALLLLLLAACGSGSASLSGDASAPRPADTVLTSPQATSPPPPIAATSTTRPPPTLPDASPGPFPVGHTLLHVEEDASGPALNAHVWYPSSDASGARSKPEIIPGLAIESRLAIDDPPPAPGRFPVILYSHGSGGFGLVATFFTEILASHGFVVVAPDHPGDTIVDAYVRTQTGGSLDLVGAVDNRVVDLGRILAAVVRTSSSDGPLAGVVDPEQVILAGHSLGGAGALEAAVVTDADAVIVMDPSLQVVPPEALAGIKVPVLVMTGSAWNGDTGPFELGSAGPWFRVAIPTAPHASFSDACDYGALLPGWLAAGMPAALGPYVEGLIATNCVPPAMAPARLRDLVDGASISFLRWALDGDTTWDALIALPQPDATIEHSPR